MAHDSNGATETHYDVLGVARDATLDTIRGAYRRLAIARHPDVNPEPDAQAEMARINVAWTILRDRGKRASYDRSLPGAAVATGAVRRDMRRPATGVTHGEPQPFRASESRRPRIVAFALFGAALVAVGSILASIPQRHAAPPAGPLYCVRDDADLDHPQALQVSPLILAAIARSYDAPEVVGLRNELRAYRNGPAGVVAAGALRGVPRARIGMRFNVMSIERSARGGYTITLQFVDDPVAIHRAWVDRAPNGTYAIRSWETAACSPREARWLAVTYGNIFASVSAGR